MTNGRLNHLPPLEKRNRVRVRVRVRGTDEKAISEKNGGRWSHSASHVKIFLTPNDERMRMVSMPWLDQPCSRGVMRRHGGSPGVSST